MNAQSEKFVSDKFVIVTGGAGYIGSHACKALAASGYIPVTVDTLEHGFQRLVQWGPLEIGNILDTAWLITIMEKYRPVAVMHFAGLINVGQSVREPGIYYETNVAGTISLLNAMTTADIKNLIVSSSCAVHGIPQSVPIREGDPCDPINPYGRSKWLAEQIIRDVAGATSMAVMMLRYFNAAGADPDCQTGELHNPETHLIPLCINAALAGKPFSLFGTDYDTPDGTAIRDYIHVSDLAHAHVLSLEHILKHGGVHALNLGTGKGTSVREIITAVEAMANKPLPVNLAPRREGDPPVLVADPKNAMNLLNFQPRHSDIMTILQTAWAWHTKVLAEGPAQ